MFLASCRIRQSKAGWQQQHRCIELCMGSGIILIWIYFGESTKKKSSFTFVFVLFTLILLLTDVTTPSPSFQPFYCVLVKFQAIIDDSLYSENSVEICEIRDTFCLRGYLCVDRKVSIWTSERKFTYMLRWFLIFSHCCVKSSFEFPCLIILLCLALVVVVVVRKVLFDTYLVKMLWCLSFFRLRFPSFERNTSFI